MKIIKSVNNKRKMREIKNDEHSVGLVFNFLIDFTKLVAII